MGVCTHHMLLRNLLFALDAAENRHACMSVMAAGAGVSVQALLRQMWITAAGQQILSFCTGAQVMWCSAPVDRYLHEKLLTINDCVWVTPTEGSPCRPTPPRCGVMLKPRAPTHLLLVMVVPPARRGGCAARRFRHRENYFSSSSLLYRRFIFPPSICNYLLLRPARRGGCAARR